MTAASGGHDWLFADPYAYQYSQISDHVRDLESRSIHSTAGSAICELEGSLPSLAEHGAETSECFELVRWRLFGAACPSRWAFSAFSRFSLSLYWDARVPNVVRTMS